MVGKWAGQADEAFQMGTRRESERKLARSLVLVTRRAWQTVDHKLETAAAREERCSRHVSSGMAPVWLYPRLYGPDKWGAEMKRVS